MTADQRGRSRKPKYLIPDIGGPGRTAEDASTERVLNFLISGTEASLEAARVEPTHAPESPPVTSRTPEPATRKSLAHLFEQASSGVGKNLTLDLPPPDVPLSVDQTSESKPVIEESAVAESPGAPVVESPAAGELGGPAEPSAAAQSPSLSESPATPTPPESSPARGISVTDKALARYVEVWKRFYRLSDGEVRVLRSVYQLSHGLGSDQCYVKMHILAEMSELTYRYCQKVVRNLEVLGWIIKLKNYNPADQLGTLYRVNLVNTANLPPDI